MASKQAATLQSVACENGDCSSGGSNPSPSATIKHDCAKAGCTHNVPSLSRDWLSSHLFLHNYEIAAILSVPITKVQGHLFRHGLRRTPELRKTLNARAEGCGQWKGGISLNSYAYTKLQRAKYPERHKARSAVARALRHGRLVKGPCRDCGDVLSYAHHEDYSKPLEVIWLCRKHHKSQDKARQILDRFTNENSPEVGQLVIGDEIYAVRACNLNEWARDRLKRVGTLEAENSKLRLLIGEMRVTLGKFDNYYGTQPRKDFADGTATPVTGHGGPVTRLNP